MTTNMTGFVLHLLLLVRSYLLGSRSRLFEHTVQQAIERQEALFALPSSCTDGKCVHPSADLDKVGHFLAAKNVLFVALISLQRFADQSTWLTPVLSSLLCRFPRSATFQKTLHLAPYFPPQ